MEIKCAQCDKDLYEPIDVSKAKGLSFYLKLTRENAEGSKMVEPLYFCTKGHLWMYLGDINGHP